MTEMDLLNILEDLGDNEFGKFKWSLKYEKVSDITPIKESQLMKAERRDAVDLMMQKYEFAGAVDVIKSILTKINRNDLVRKLPNIGSGAEVKTSTEKQNTVLLQTVTVWVEGREGKRKVCCLMDGGSQQNFMLEKQVPGEQILSGRVGRRSESLVAIETLFGWTVQGPVSMSSMSEAPCMKIGIEETTQVSNQLSAFWQIESLGISIKGEERADDIEVQQNFDQSVRWKGQYWMLLTTRTALKVEGKPEMIHASRCQRDSSPPPWRRWMGPPQCVI
eukprot:superscaffoldBa00002392_g14099